MNLLKEKQNNVKKMYDENKKAAENVKAALQ